jgi:hypothetical protein
LFPYSGSVKRLFRGVVPFGAAGSVFVFGADKSAGRLIFRRAAIVNRAVGKTADHDGSKLVRIAWHDAPCTGLFAAFYPWFVR